MPVGDPVDNADALEVWDGVCVGDQVPDDDRVTTRLWLGVMEIVRDADDDAATLED